MLAKRPLLRLLNESAIRTVRTVYIGWQCYEIGMFRFFKVMLFLVVCPAVRIASLFKPYRKVHEFIYESSFEKEKATGEGSPVAF